MSRAKPQRRRSRIGDWQTDQATWGVVQSVPPLAFATNFILGIQPVAQQSPIINPGLPGGLMGQVAAVGEIIIAEVDVRLDIFNVDLSGLYQYGVGLYLSEWDSTLNTWQAQNPIIANDMVRDNWLSWEVEGLQMQRFTDPLAHPYCTTFSAQRRHRIHLKRRVRISEGLALALTLSNAAVSAGTISYSLFTRHKRVLEV